MTKKPTKHDRDDFELHVRLLQRQHGLKIGEARAAAWLSGPDGMAKLLGAPVAGLSAPVETEKKEK